jgi:hypothetical protein
MPEMDMFAYTVGALGEPEHARKVAPDEAAPYADRVPPALIRFWVEHGRGAFQAGKFWICDPAPFQPVIAEVFAEDPELDPAEMTVVGYSAFGTLKVWHRRRRAIKVDFLFSQVFNPPESSWHDKATGQPFSPDFSIGTHLTDFQYGPAQVDPSGEDLLPQAIARQGPLSPGEIYGFAPALQLGGAYAVENLRRVAAAPHLMILAELARFDLTRLSPPQPPGHPYGRVEVVRKLGKPQ